jgi:hypothetical protein
MANDCSGNKFGSARKLPIHRISFLWLAHKHRAAFRQIFAYSSQIALLILWRYFAGVEQYVRSAAC